MTNPHRRRDQSTDTAPADNDTKSSPHSPPEQPPLLTVDEAAELLRIDRKTLYSAIRRKEIPGVRRISRVIRIHRPTLVAWLSASDPRPT